MQFIDLARQQNRIKKRIDTRIQAVLDHGKYIMGPEVQELEEKLANYINVKHAISCSSGTDALLLSLLSKNIGHGDAIFTSPFTFIATAEIISILGATPVFVDIDPKTFNIDPEKLKHTIDQTKLIDLTPKGIVPVDLFGLPADYESINALAMANDLVVFGDSAQSFGAEYQGKKAGSFSDISSTSFFPAKPLGCYGDGGMCFTNNDETAEILKSLRMHGKGTHKYDNTRIGINGRMDTIQAAILLAKFEIYPEEFELRQQIAGTYSKLLADKNSQELKAPYIPSNCRSAWAQYSVLAKSQDARTKLQYSLKESNIPTAVYYPKPLHLQTAFSGLGYKKGDFPISEDCSERIFSLPMHPYLSFDDQRQIISIINNS